MNDDEIKQSDLELTEQELNKIFFSPGEVKYNPPGVKKLEKKKIIIEKPKPKSEIGNSKVEEKIEEPEKRPQGRPKKWTKEKIAELKLLQKKESEAKKKQKDELLDIAKLAMTTPMSDYQRNKLLRKNIERKKEIENEIVEKKETDRKILNQKENINLWNKPKCNRHKYKISYIDQSNNIVAACNICSEQKIFLISEWQRYIQTTRRLYNE